MKFSIEMKEDHPDKLGICLLKDDVLNYKDELNRKSIDELKIMIPRYDVIYFYTKDESVDVMSEDVSSSDRILLADLFKYIYGLLPEVTLKIFTSVKYENIVFGNENKDDNTSRFNLLKYINLYVYEDDECIRVIDSAASMRTNSFTLIREEKKI